MAFAVALLDQSGAAGASRSQAQSWCVSASEYVPSETKNFNNISCRSASGPQADSQSVERFCTGLSHLCAPIVEAQLDDLG
jgi:hypothetical protein